MKCIKCNNELPDNATFCNMCGQPIQSNYNNENNSSKKFLVILCVAILIVAVIGIIVMLTKKKDNNKPITTTEGISTEKVSTSEQEYNSSGIAKPSHPIVKIDTSNPTIIYEDESQRSKNIVFKKLFYMERNERYNYAYALLENNNDTMITAKIYINFYKGDQRIGSEQLYAQHIKPHTTFVADGTISFAEEYDRYDISIKGDIVSSVYHDVETEISKIKSDIDDRKNITATYLNETDKVVTYYANIIYYKNGEVVHVYDTISSSINPGDNAKFNFYATTQDGIDYDNYVVNIQSATYRDANY